MDVMPGERAIEVRVSPDEAGWTADVSVREGATATSHRVTVDPGTAERLTAGAAALEQLLTASFEFLLEREPKESILREFDITVISRYFPEYEDEIRRRLGTPGPS